MAAAQIVAPVATSTVRYTDDELLPVGALELKTFLAKFAKAIDDSLMRYMRSEKGIIVLMSGLPDAERVDKAMRSRKINEMLPNGYWVSEYIQFTNATLPKRAAVSMSLLPEDPNGPITPLTDPGTGRRRMARLAGQSEPSEDIAIELSFDFDDDISLDESIDYAGYPKYPLDEENTTSESESVSPVSSHTASVRYTKLYGKMGLAESDGTVEVVGVDPVGRENLFVSCQEKLRHVADGMAEVLFGRPQKTSVAILKAHVCTSGNLTLPVAAGAVSYVTRLNSPMYIIAWPHRFCAADTEDSPVWFAYVGQEAYACELGYRRGDTLKGSDWRRLSIYSACLSGELKYKVEESSSASTQWINPFRLLYARLQDFAEAGKRVRKVKDSSWLSADSYVERSSVTSVTRGGVDWEYSTGWRRAKQ